MSEGDSGNSRPQDKAVVRQTPAPAPVPPGMKSKSMPDNKMTDQRQ